MAAHQPPTNNPAAARIAEEAAEAARLATYPPPYPDSWYVLCRSEEVRDEPLSVDALGQRFVKDCHPRPECVKLGHLRRAE